MAHISVERTDEDLTLDQFVKEGIDSSNFCSDYIYEIQKIDSSFLPKFSYDFYQNWIFDVTSLVVAKNLQNVLTSSNGKVNNR